MTCYHPLQGWRSKYTNNNGKRNIVFNIQQALVNESVTVPCGRCIGCRLERSRQWAMRCVHEASLHQENSYITLTYNSEKLPPHGTLVKKDYQDFMKRLRKRLEPKRIRYFMCGEYGEKRRRPHYHACIFGHQFSDLVLDSVNNGYRLYTSKFLDEVWSNGNAWVGDVTFESAAYVARYITKKITGDLAFDHYTQSVDIVTGEIITRLPEYTDMSRRPGIAAEWYDRFKRDLDKDFITMRGVKMKPPRYYDKLLEKEDPNELELRKSVRKENAKIRIAHSTPERLEVREKIQQKRYTKLKRGFDDEN